MTIDPQATTAGEWEGTHRPVVVAVDGSDRNRSAVHWAAHEAAAEGAEVVLVTALHDRVVHRPDADEHTRAAAALAMLDRVRSEVRHLVDEQSVDTLALPGGPVEVLLDRAVDARLVVVGKRGLGGFARLLVGSTSIALAGRSPVPVAIVPDDWDPAAHEGQPVVLGVDAFKHEHRPVHLAFRRAKRLGVPVVAVHGWEAPPVLSWDADVITGALAEHEREAAARFDELVASWREHFPDVEVRPTNVHRHPATAVLEAAEKAQLVVLGRHDPGLLGGFAVGSVARAVLHYSETPVITVPVGEPSA